MKNCEKKTQNGQKWLFQIFSDNFFQKDWYKLETAKNGHSKFFLKIFPKKTGINLGQSKMAIPNFFQQFFPKRLIDWYKFGMAILSFFPTIFPKKTGINLEQPKMGIPNLFKPF